MRSVFDPTDRERLIARLRLLRNDSKPRWGRMSSHQMLCHIADQLRCGLGDLPSTPRKTLLRHRALRLVAVHLMPWPKARISTAPEMLTTRPGRWEEDRSRMEELIERAAQRGPAGDWAVHPGFGPMSGVEWGWLIHKHTDYHLRQFGT